MLTQSEEHPAGGSNFDHLKRFKFGSEEFRTYFRTVFIERDAKLEYLKMKDGYWYVFSCFARLLLVIIGLAYSISEYRLSFIGLFAVYFLLGNLIEYLTHRYPMHNRYSRHNLIYAHTTIHHNFYNDVHFYYETHRDFMAVLLPWYTFLYLTVIIGAASGIVYWVAGMDHALFFALCGYGYYLLYEVLHFTYHASPMTPIKKLSFIRRLAQHHLQHHNYTCMNKYNFNIAFPIFDRILGTLYRK